MNDKDKIITYLNKLKSKPKKKELERLIKKYKIKIPHKKTTLKSKYNYIKKNYNIKKNDLLHEITVNDLKKILKKNKINNIGKPNKKKMFTLLEKFKSKIPNNNITFTYYSKIGRRPYQEDRLAIHHNAFHYISGVFDGHAGNKCSVFLKQNFYKTFIPKLNKKKHPSSALYFTFMELDKKFLEMINSNDGSTCNILYCDKARKMCYIANTGDSRAILCRNNGIVRQITKDHKPNDPKEKQSIESKGGFVRDNRTNGNLAMSRAFGDKYLKNVITAEPDIMYFPMRNIKYILQASDGLFDVMSNVEICNFINLRLNRNIDINTITQELVSYAINSKGSYDNTSVIITLFT